MQLHSVEPGVYLCNKPSGVTSFGLVGRIRKLCNTRKVGHAGTLDPAASGLMLVGVDKGTKKLNKYVGLDKTYEAVMLIGKQTTTGDQEGDVIQEVSVPKISTTNINSVLKSLVGEIFLPVPVFSAIKRAGEPLYKKARRQEVVVPPVRLMKVYKIDLVKSSYQEEKQYLHITLRVASGVYVRSVAEEIGRRLGYPASLFNLKRTKIGNFSLKLL